MTQATLASTDLEKVEWWRNAACPLVWSESSAVDAVFDPATGETHLLNELPGLILRAIDTQPRNAGRIIEAMAGASAEELGRSGRDQVIAALDYLRGAELIESRVPELP